MAWDDEQSLARERALIGMMEGIFTVKTDYEDISKNADENRDELFDSVPKDVKQNIRDLLVAGVALDSAAQENGRDSLTLMHASRIIWHFCLQYLQNRYSHDVAMAFMMVYESLGNIQGPGGFESVLSFYGIDTEPTDSTAL